MHATMPWPSPKMALRQGFTLIELLVVISIIAVLAGMLIPTVSMVREMAQGTRCQSNQRQVALAAFGYANDNESGLPATRLVTGAYWFDLMMDYLEIGKKGIAAAPEDYWKNTIIRGCPTYKYVYVPNNVGYSYGINAYLDYGTNNNVHNRIGGTSNPSLFKEFKLGVVRKASTRTYLADRDSFWTGSGMSTFPVTKAEVRHRQRVTVTFLDGHGARLTPAEDLIAQTSP